MHNEKGYVCCVLSTKDLENSRDHEIWFGSKKNNPTSSALRMSEAFTTNGFKTFPALRDAKKAQKELSRKPFVRKTRLIRLEMNVAETPDDSNALKKTGKLVSITTTQSPHQQDIFGAIAVGQYLDADFSTRYIDRKRESGALIATFETREVR